MRTFRRCVFGNPAQLRPGLLVEKGICTKPLARRTIPRVRKVALKGWSRGGPTVSGLCGEQEASCCLVAQILNRGQTRGLLNRWGAWRCASAFVWCAEHVLQLEGENPFDNLMR
jgi:hypothetical protein